MKTAKPTPASPAHDRLVDALGDCLTPETAQRLLKVKTEPKLQARIDFLAKRNNKGLLKPEEQSEYESYVSFIKFVAVLQTKSRQVLDKSQED